MLSFCPNKNQNIEFKSKKAALINNIIDNIKTNNKYKTIKDKPKNKNEISKKKIALNDQTSTSNNNVNIKNDNKKQENKIPCVKKDSLKNTNNYKFNNLHKKHYTTINNNLNKLLNDFNKHKKSDSEILFQSYQSNADINVNNSEVFYNNIKANIKEKCKKKINSKKFKIRKRSSNTKYFTVTNTNNDSNFQNSVSKIIKSHKILINNDEIFSPAYKLNKKIYSSKNKNTNLINKFKSKNLFIRNKIEGAKFKNLKKYNLKSINSTSKNLRRHNFLKNENIFTTSSILNEKSINFSKKYLNYNNNFNVAKNNNENLTNRRLSNNVFKKKS